MRKILTIAGSTMAVVLVAALVASAAQKHAARGATTVHVIEHATTDTVVDNGKKGDSVGDLLVWHNKVYDAWDQKLAGKDQGDCTRIDPRSGSWECRWITWVKGGSLTVEGPVYDTRDSVLAVTGGTGAYKDSDGVMVLKSRNGGAEYDFIFILAG